MTAGIAVRRTNLDIGVAETETTPAGQSLALRGSGSSYASFAWSGPSAATPGQVNAGQSFTTVSSEPGATPAGRPLAVRLAGPNPFGGATAIMVASAEAVPDARVELFDVVGRRVAVLHRGPLAAGDSRLLVDGSALPAGVYVVRVLAGAESATLRLVVTGR